MISVNTTLVVETQSNILNFLKFIAVGKRAIETCQNLHYSGFFHLEYCATRGIDNKVQ